MREAELSPLVGTIHRDVTWGDCDPAGIIFYPTYFRWIDAGTWNLFFKAGLTLERLRAEYGAMDFPIINAQLTFSSPARFGTSAELRSFVEHWGGKSFRVHHEIVRADGARLAEGSETRAWVLNSSGGVLQARPIPDSLKQRFFVKV